MALFSSAAGMPSPLFALSVCVRWRRRVASSTASSTEAGLGASLCHSVQPAPATASNHRSSTASPPSSRSSSTSPPPTSGLASSFRIDSTDLTTSK
eukprot:CAMPEP_0114151968 /NCGR_PEP_ID=MMETSP0043_2-20121206/23543_1 /TAXON_ID=464988 /ORGANISM="Hemiselmis andersenii, Strain CCMP644" /LENGTH=95 /DNA_ID=CAMNT_0001246849 /DNA_START=477 /DNA_END=761 /DNA_ORIENTATION=+